MAVVIGAVFLPQAALFVFQRLGHIDEIATVFLAKLLQFDIVFVHIGVVQAALFATQLDGCAGLDVDLIYLHQHLL